MPAERSGSPGKARDYRQTARAEAAEVTRLRIVEAFSECWRRQWFDEITLEEVADRAEVSVRTVIRQFGGKEGLVGAFVTYVAPQVDARRTVTPGDIGEAINRLVDNYEVVGDATIRALAQEERLPALGPLIRKGRDGHRAIIGANFAPWLDPLPPADRPRAVDALVIVTDIYAWKLLRRDMGRSEKETRSMMCALVKAALTEFAAGA